MTLSIHHLTPADYHVMPWKNGQGTTTELLVHPKGAGLDTFTWRVSIADIAAPGPFSAFPGISRVILQTAGEPMTLVHEGRGRHRLALFQPHRFEGEWETQGEVSGPVRDFNVMARRGRVRASVTVHELAPGSRVTVLAPGSTHLVHAFRGALSVTAAATGEGWSLAEGDTWHISGDEGDDTGFDLAPKGALARGFVLGFA